eukprot:357516-Prorocentrum_lima.AAC.1
MCIRDSFLIRGSGAVMRGRSAHVSTPWSACQRRSWQDLTHAFVDWAWCVRSSRCFGGGSGSSSSAGRSLPPDSSQ